MDRNRRIVIKVGTSTLTGGGTHLHQPQMVDLVRQMAQLEQGGEQIIFVSSGAIAAGREALAFPELPKSIPGKQMLAAVGQPRLMNIYENLFEIFGLRVAQILLTREDIAARTRYINARNTLNSLLDHGIIPIINENDSIATEEIRIGDNDNLSAMVANLIEADLLVLLTDQDGLFTADPRNSSDAQLIELIDSHDIPEVIWDAAGGAKNGLGTGGMVTKLQAADTARRSGTAVVIARGDQPDVLLRIAKGECTGTSITASVDALESRKRFMLAGISSDSAIVIDKGAETALISGGSLLPVGIRDVTGEFDRGDIVQIQGEEGKRIAAGLVNYSADEVRKLIGVHSSQIESTLGYGFGDEIMHHNNMAVLR